MASFKEELARKRDHLRRVSKDQARDRSAPQINPSAKLMCIPRGTTSDLNGASRVDEILRSCRRLPDCLPDRAVVVWAVRHAERADEKGGKELLERQRNVDDKLAKQFIRGSVGQNCTCKCDFRDPPLTFHGPEQAYAVGRTLSNRGVSVDAIFASPTLRTSETGAQIAKSLLDHSSLSAVSLQRVTVLSRCTSAGAFMAADHLKVLVGDKRVCIPELDDNNDTFLASVERLASSAAASAAQGKRHPDLLIVTHREGLWELMSAAGMTSLPYMPPYACICKLIFVPQSLDVYDDQDSGQDGTVSWYLAPGGFDVGYCVANESSESLWTCCNCSGREDTSSYRIWGLGPCTVNCNVCGKLRQWYCRVPDDTSSH